MGFRAQNNLAQRDAFKSSWNRTKYDYDDVDRVTRADYLVNELTNVYEAFNMDDLGNRESTTLRDGSSDTYSIDTTTNRYNSIDAASLDYDTAGNLTQDKDGYVYTYDYENRITKIVDDQQALIAEFDYDTQGRRVRVYDAVADTTTLYYYSDDWQVLSEYNNSGTQQAYYVYGNYIDEALLMHRNSADKFYLHDHLYSPVALSDSDGAVVERYEYDAYGKATIWDSTLQNIRTPSSYGNPYYLAGRERDTLNGSGLDKYHLRYRDLDSYMGVFYQNDPHGISPNGGEYNSFVPLIQYKDGINLYEYTRSNPMINADIYGTDVYLAGTNGRRIIDIFHVNICVDEWNEYTTPDGEKIYFSEAKFCVSFGITSKGDSKKISWPERDKWLKWKVHIPKGCYYTGTVYVSDFEKEKIISQMALSLDKETQVREETRFREELKSWVGEKDVWSLEWNCRDFSTRFFSDAMNWRSNN